MSRPDPECETFTVHVPFQLVKRGGRKAIQLPDGAPQAPKIDSTLHKALARAFRWKHILETGEVTTMAELAARENIAQTYMTRVLRLSLLAPDIVEAIMDGTAKAELTLARVLETFPAKWDEQRQQLGHQRVARGNQ